MKLALLAATGVAVMHAVHLSLGNRIAGQALGQEQERLGRSIARLLADQATDAVLVNDLVALDAVTALGSRPDTQRPGYCFITRNGAVLASSFGPRTPEPLSRLRRPGEREPLVVLNGDEQVLDLVEPIMGGVAELRLGLDMAAISATRRALAIELGVLAVAMILAGLAAALVFGRSLVRPIDELLASAASFDPRVQAGAPVVPRGSDELAMLAQTHNEMLTRLREAHAEQERARAHAVETERMAALGALIAGVSHEVNNPLAGLKNCVHRLANADVTPAKRKEYLELMDEGLARIENVVKGLLDFGRPHPPHLEVLSTRDLAERATHLVRSQLARRGVSCVVEGPGLGASVLADRHRIGQALVNLLLNAGAASPAGAVVRLHLVDGPALAGVAVADEGPGIPEALRARVFEPFFTTKPPGEGTGLGLPVTRSIVDAHGGMLELSFPATGGTVATVWLRRAPAPAST
jgi:two-component system NtrC family sensor kinase